MSSDHELHLIADQASATSSNSKIYLTSGNARNSSSRSFSPIKYVSKVTRPLWLLLLRLASSAYSNWFVDWWTLELLSWVLAALAFGMIITVLVIYHDQPLPEWPSNITLNSLLSVLSQVAQWGLMGSIAKALGQLKWLWFKKKRSLNEFVVIDEASRGPWGSFLLCIKGQSTLVTCR